MKFLAKKLSKLEIIKSENGCAALISAILDQAFSDALSRSSSILIDSKGARRFIDEYNILFKLYCELLDWEPEYVAKKMQKALREGWLKPLKELRE